MITVTQEANTVSKRLLESVGVAAVESFTEYGERQLPYTLADAHPDEVDS
ncbi:hypothetical protein ABZ769_33850 [Streptomyces olivoreticuli]